MITLVDKNCPDGSWRWSEESKDSVASSIVKLLLKPPTIDRACAGDPKIGRRVDLVLQMTAQEDNRLTFECADFPTIDQEWLDGRNFRGVPIEIVD